MYFPLENYTIKMETRITSLPVEYIEKKIGTSGLSPIFDQKQRRTAKRRVRSKNEIIEIDV